MVPMTFELNHTYHTMVKWTPFSSTETINVTLDGVPIISTSDKTINQSGLVGFAMHKNAPNTIWWDDLVVTPS
jgi:hypothetical protein